MIRSKRKLPRRAICSEVAGTAEGGCVAIAGLLFWSHSRIGGLDQKPFDLLSGVVSGRPGSPPVAGSQMMGDEVAARDQSLQSVFETTLRRTHIIGDTVPAGAVSAVL